MIVQSSQFIWVFVSFESITYVEQSSVHIMQYPTNQCLPTKILSFAYWFRPLQSALEELIDKKITLAGLSPSVATVWPRVSVGCKKQI